MPGGREGDVGLLASVAKRYLAAAVTARCFAGAVDVLGHGAAPRGKGSIPFIAVLFAVPCTVLAGCSDKAVRIAPPTAWTAEVNREAAPLATASIGPETASETESKTVVQSTVPVKEPEKSKLQTASLDARPLKLRKGGGYRKIGKRYQVRGVWYTPRHDENYEETGMASWYGDGFHAKKTANGEMYDMNALTAAHRTLPLPSLVRVTNIENGRSLVVRVNDRGPFKKGRIIDVSARAARELQFADKGVAKVHVKYVGPAPLDGNDARERASLAASAR